VPSFFSEIEKFPREVLAHHYPDVPLHGDFTTIEANQYGSIDLLVGGTPCQSFSIAGLRKGLDDDRGNLSLEFIKLAQRERPRWVVWENVPGVLSSNGGKDFGSFLGALGEIGYGFAYRVLDAQYFGVAQRRRRVFVVGYLGDWRRAAAVLFERESLRGNPAPSREAGEKPAPTVTSGPPFSRTGNDRVECDAYIPEIAGSLDTQCGGGKLTHQSANNGHLVLEREITGTLTARMFNSLGARDIEEGAIHPMAFDAYNQEETKQVSKTIASRNDQDTASCIAFQSNANACDAIALAENTIGRQPMNGGNGDGFTEGGPMYTLNATGVHGVAQSMAVRRLTPTECERLQGFPDGYTNIKEKCPDAPRYKALGNSMAVPVMKWIGERIQMVEQLTHERAITS